MKIDEYYDVFISFKDSDENGKDTKDKVIAHELYEYLTSKNLKVFFSSETFEKHGTDQWKNELKNGDISYYINYRNEVGKPVKVLVGKKTKSSDFTAREIF